MRNLRLVALALTSFAASTSAWSAGQTSTNFAIPKDTINAGVADMSSTNFRLSASVGAAASGGTSTSASFRLASGFRAQVLDIFTSPSPPTLNSITPGPGRATLTFTAPGNTGGSAVTSYTATCTSPGQITRSASGSASPLTVTGLAGGFFYSCSITATNASGFTSASSAVFSVTPTAAPSGIAPLLMYLLD